MDNYKQNKKKQNQPSVYFLQMQSFPFKNSSLHLWEGAGLNCRGETPPGQELWLPKGHMHLQFAEQALCPVSCSASAAPCCHYKEQSQISTALGAPPTSRRLRACGVAVPAPAAGRATNTSPSGLKGSREQLQFEAVHAGGQQDKEWALQ